MGVLSCSGTGWKHLRQKSSKQWKKTLICFPGLVTISSLCNLPDPYVSQYFVNNFDFFHFRSRITFRKLSIFTNFVTVFELGLSLSQPSYFWDYFTHSRFAMPLVSCMSQLEIPKCTLVYFSHRCLTADSPLHASVTARQKHYSQSPFSIHNIITLDLQQNFPKIIVTTEHREISMCRWYF